VAHDAGPGPDHLSVDGSIGWHWPGGGPDPRLEQAIAELDLRLELVEPDDQSEASRIARAYLNCAIGELNRRWAHNEEAWAWFHAAKREELRLRSAEDLRLLEIDLTSEVNEKLQSSWRRNAVERYGLAADRLNRVTRIQKHIDETAENNNRKRLLQRRQLIIYLAFLTFVLLVISLLEFLGRGLILAGSSVDGWWVVSAVLYGTLGGAFSAAQRVAAAGPTARYPELRWAQLANTFRPLAGGAGALIAFAALQANVIGSGAGDSGPRVALVSFVAGFSERFIPSLAAQQLPSK
jgi:hypothetical protein